MKRNNGFITLNIEPNKIKNIKEFKPIFWINNKILFKQEKEDLVYNELIVEEIAKLFNIDTPHYDIAIVNGIYGNISYNYKKDNYTYIQGSKILEEYSKEININQSELYKMNNLETIWNALEYYFKNHKNKDKIIENIMNSLVKYYLLDILIGQIDRSSFNYEIMYNDEYGSLAPYYDNALAFDFNITYPRLSVDNKSRTYYDELEYFFKESSIIYKDLFISMYNTLTPYKLEEIFNIVEKRINTKIDDKIKNKIIGEYCAHYIRLDYYVLKGNNMKKV